MRTIVRMKDIKKDYGFTTALQGISINVKANEFIAVLGKSGSGKSTLFHIMSGLLTPDNAQLIINDKDIIKMKKKEFINFRS